MAQRKDYSPARTETGTASADVPQNGNGTADVAIPAEVTGTVQALTAAQRYHNYMLRRAQEIGSERGAEINAAQMARILAAGETEDVDAIWNADDGGTVQARDVPGLEVRIHDMVPIVSNREDIANNKGYYVSMNATVLGGPEDMLTRNALELGGNIVLQTGADLIETKIRAFESIGKLPVDGVVTAIRTGSGNEVLKLRPMPKRVQS